MITSFYVGPVWVGDVADKLRDAQVKVFQEGTTHVWIDTEDHETNAQKARGRVLNKLYARFGSVFGLRADGRG